MGLPWVSHWSPMGLPRVSHRSPMGLPRVFHGSRRMDRPRFRSAVWFVAHWSPMGLLWLIYGFPMGLRLPRDSHGASENGNYVHHPKYLVVFALVDRLMPSINATNLCRTHDANAFKLGSTRAHLVPWCCALLRLIVRGGFFTQKLNHFARITCKPIRGSAPS